MVPLPKRSRSWNTKLQNPLPQCLSRSSGWLSTKLWDHLLTQTKITLNLLRQSNATPTVSAYAHLNGPFGYNKMQLAPMGCAVQVHEKSNSRGTWAYHSVDGLYFATSPDNYRTHTCHIKSTQSKLLSNTVHFKHKNITNPSLSHTNKIMKAIAGLANFLKHNPVVTAKQEQEILKR